LCNYCDYAEYLHAAVFHMRGRPYRNDDDLHKLVKLIAPEKSIHDFQYLPLEKEHIEKIKLLGGPHGRAILKMMEARNDSKRTGDTS
jgi:hypothetical protein